MPRRHEELPFPINSENFARALWQSDSPNTGQVLPAQQADPK
jgi:hypothetical protein